MTHKKWPDPNIPKGSLGGQCSRTVCSIIARHESKTEPGRFYCHRCMLSINEMNALGQEIISPVDLLKEESDESLHEM